MDPLSACLLVTAALAPAQAAPLVLRGASGVEVTFGRDGDRLRWTGYRDPAAGLEWTIAGPRFSLQTRDGARVSVGDVGFELDPDAAPDGTEVTLRATLPAPHVEVSQTFSFCDDGRTLRVRTRLRSLGDPVTVQRVGLLEVKVPGQAFRIAGPGFVSSPVVGDRLFAGIEHPSALCQADGAAFWLAQHSYLAVGPEWVRVPVAVFGSASEQDVAAAGDPVKRAFLRYLDTVRIKPRDTHVHYNNWWTMPVPFSEKDVLGNIAELRRGLYDQTGFFFDSYAMDMGWSDPHTVWEMDRANYPDGFGPIRDALAAVGSRPGLWVSPSSLYPPALDNAWLEQAGYEVTPRPGSSGFACLALGGRYQRAFRDAVLRHAREGHFAHVKFDGLAWPCDVASHGHPVGVESYLPITEGLMDVLDALRAQDPDIALEPTCLGYNPSPWWLMHTPFVIGPFGDDSPRGVCPSPEWIESMTTGRDLANLRGQDAFWMPSSALECFDVIVQCPGDFYNHGTMAVARGHWFQSTYINPKHMDPDEWRFFARLMTWARAHREELHDPVVFGGDPAARQAYGYAYVGAEQQRYFVRNPWMEEARTALPGGPSATARILRAVYPVREVVGYAAAGEALPEVELGPYELLVLEVTPTQGPPATATPRPAPEVAWNADRPAGYEHITYDPEPAPYGPDWTSPQGDAAEAFVWSSTGELRCDAPSEVCLLVDGPPGSDPATASAKLDGMDLRLRESGSRGSFSAAGAAPVEEWQWFLARLEPGAHRLAFEVSVPAGAVRCGLFLRGAETRAPEDAGAFDGPGFPLPPGAGRSWSRTLIPLTSAHEAGVTERGAQREIVRIDGVYLDSLAWVEATAGWGEVHRNASIMGTPMTLGGRAFRRGLGAHAASRIVYDLPEGYARLAATLGCDQEVYSNSVVFVVEGDGRELYRSPLMRRDMAPVDIDVPIAGVKRLILLLEDGGDGIGADHGDWADARLLR